MRIIAGRLKGRRLVPFKAKHLRPTTDRVKESIFNMLQAVTLNARFLDLYAGTGNLAFEALSRGAREVWSVESDRTSLKIIKENQVKLGIEEGHVVVPSDVSRFLASYDDAPFDVILIDPPFTEKLSDSTMEVLSKSKAFNSDSVIYIESARSELVQEQYGALKRVDTRSFGDKLISIFKVAF